MRTILLSFALLISANLFSQTDTIEVMTLGTFHFNFPNRDLITYGEDEQIDVLDPQYQAEIEDITNSIAKFNPTMIAIEADPKYQPYYDSLYHSYLNGEYELARDERQQIGFRLAKQLGLNKLYCTNDWGKHYEFIDEFFESTDTIPSQKFMDYFYDNPDTVWTFYPEEIFKTEGIKAQLISDNQTDNLELSLGAYFHGIFKYETEDDPFFGVDFTTGWWFNRNLRIFRNIQKMNPGPDDRVLVIYGSGHMNLLNVFFESSPQFKLVPVNDYLMD